jgi:hypothetical protein
MIVINWLFRKRKKTLRSKFLHDIVLRFRSIDQQPFTTEAEDEIDTLIEIEKAFHKAAREKIGVFYSDIADAFSYLGKAGFYDTETGVLLSITDEEEGKVIRIQSHGNTVPRDLLIYPDGEYTLLETVEFSEVIRFLYFVNCKLAGAVFIREGTERLIKS